MFRHLIRQFGLTILGLSICLACSSIDSWTTALRQNTVQIASAVTCKQDLAHSAEYQVGQISASINAWQLNPLPIKDAPIRKK